MSTITKEFTKEQLIERLLALQERYEWALAAVPEKKDTAVDLQITKIALASLEAEPVSFNELRDAVAEVSGGPAMEWSDIYKGHQAVPFINFNSLARIVEKFRTAPSAPVSVPDAYIRDDRGRMILNGESEPRIGYGAGWNACRAAMLRD